jgi:hypothetical protein
VRGLRGPFCWIVAFFAFRLTPDRCVSQWMMNVARIVRFDGDRSVV